ncbi:MAG TPA: hypothetical protein VMD59_07870, partial [Acidimicrobiales bacterium]|nr:hypothetical protein [Acidimicrobiales bacterium]
MPSRTHLPPEDPARQERVAAIRVVLEHPLFAPFGGGVHFELAEPAAGAGLARVSGIGTVSLHPSRRAPRAEWVWAISHCLLHLGFEHHGLAPMRDGGFDPAWRAACCVVVNRLLEQLKLGTPPDEARAILPGGDEAALARSYAEQGIPPALSAIGAAGAEADLLPPAMPTEGSWQARLATGLSAAVAAAVDVAGGARAALAGGGGRTTAWSR